MASVRGTIGTAGRTRSGKPMVQEIVPSSAWTEDSYGHYLLVDLPDFKKEEVKLQLDSFGQITVSGERLLVKENKYVCFEQTYSVPQNSDFDNITGKFDGEILYVTVPKHVVEKKEEPEGDNENVEGIVEENVHENPNNSDENVRKDDNEKNGDGHGYHHENKGHEKHGDGHGYHHENKGNDKHGENKGNDKHGENKGNDKHGDGHGYHHENKGNDKHGDDHGYHHENKGKIEKKSHVDSFQKELLEKWGKEASQLERAMKMLKKNKGIVLTAMVAFSLGILVARKFNSAGQYEAAI